MNQQEEEQQKSIEAGLKPTGDDADIQAYYEVFSRLDREPDTHLSPGFADQVVARIVARKDKSAIRDYLWLGTGVILLMLSFLVAARKCGFTLNLGFLRSMSGYAGLFIFGAVFVTILNILDWRIIARKRDSDFLTNGGDR